MAHLAVIDDDHSAESLIDYLVGCGHEVERIATADAALSRLSELANFDLLVLDVMMARPDTLDEERTRGGYRTGLVLAQKIRAEHPELALLNCFTHSETFGPLG